MKGMELPVNTLIIVAIGVIVLIAVISVFYPSWSNGFSVANSGSAKSAACQRLVDRGCDDTTKVEIDNFDADKDGTVGDSGIGFGTCGSGANSGDNLAGLCACYYDILTELECKNLCGCMPI